jgi:hypothetical protein
MASLRSSQWSQILRPDWPGAPGAGFAPGAFDFSFPDLRPWVQQSRDMRSAAPSKSTHSMRSLISQRPRMCLSSAFIPRCSLIDQDIATSARADSSAPTRMPSSAKCPELRMDSCRTYAPAKRNTIDKQTTKYFPVLMLAAFQFRRGAPERCSLRVSYCAVSAAAHLRLPHNPRR